MKKSQKEMIFEFMATGGRINKLAAFRKFGCMTLAQRIDDIEADIDKGVIKGYKLKRRTIKEKNNACEYWLEPVPGQLSLFS